MWKKTIEFRERERERKKFSILTWHWKPCLPNPQIKSLQCEQKVGCLKKRGRNLWSCTANMVFFFNAPLRARAARPRERVKPPPPPLLILLPLPAVNNDWPSFSIDCCCCCCCVIDDDDIEQVDDDVVDDVDDVSIVELDLERLFFGDFVSFVAVIIVVGIDVDIDDDDGSGGETHCIDWFDSIGDDILSSLLL